MSTATATRRVHIETFGCQMNLSDTEVVLARLAEHGYTVSDRAEDADLILYNTCAVRDGAEAKVRGRLDSLKPIKRARPDLRIGVLGCMAQREKAALLTRHPHVDLVVGTDQFVHLPDLLTRLEEERQIVATDFGDFEAQQDWHAARRDGVNAWIPVMRGCNYHCTYCVVPMTRGKEKSRPPERIEAEVRAAVAAGHVQVTLLGQTVDAYGKTLGDGTTLASLLRRLHSIDGLRRLRFVTSHPKDITDDLLTTIGELPKVAKHLHVPAQSGSSRILRLMGRRYTRETYLALVERARRIVPGIEILTDLIAGFPTETDEDHHQTMSLLEEVRFDGAYVFQYSERPGTGAVRLGDTVDDEVKRIRCNELLVLQTKQQEVRYHGLVGEVVEMLVEGPSRNRADRLQGRSAGNLNLVIDRVGTDGGSRDQLIGKCVPVRLTEATALTLTGEPLPIGTPCTLVGSGGR